MQDGCSLQAVPARHLYVEERYVGQGIQCSGKYLVSARGFGHDLDVVLQSEQGGERATHHRLVLSQ